jgi:hypothetical protein
MGSSLWWLQLFNELVFSSATEVFVGGQTRQKKNKEQVPEIKSSGL